MEALESRQLLSADGITGDANRDGTFDQLDIAAVLTADKYLTNEHAEWSDGDWNGDDVFNQLDLVAALQGGAYVPVGSAAETDPSAGTLDQQPVVTPGELGSGAFDALQFGDPLENTVLVAAPEANNQGSAEVAHPLFIPPGRADMQPDLALVYDSAEGNGWVGVGWDLSVPEVSIDSRWGFAGYGGPIATCGGVLWHSGHRPSHP
jgi:hypothetical protein